MKYIIFVVFVLITVLLGAGYVTASQNSVNVQIQQQVQATNQKDGNQISTGSQNISSGSGQNDPGVIKRVQSITEQYRITTENTAREMLQIAENAVGVQQQIRDIVQQQNQSASTTVQLMEKIQDRNAIRTFLFGSDYNNLNILDHEVLQTRSRLEQLSQLMVNMQNENSRGLLQNQIQILEQEQAKIESFVQEKEGQFSLFGWLIRLFNRDSQ